ncbi:MAG: N-acetylmuramoyl-L-alanine amidase [Lachnospiraceae bacterium]|nr:N-acetylmuramoyl-L-alanine amidase [Lachnospiraceae bacterium]
MKKIRAAALILAFALCFSALAAGCGSSGEDESSVTQDVAQIDRSGKNLVRPGIMTVDRPGADGSDAAAPDGSGTETPAPETETETETETPAPEETAAPRVVSGSHIVAIDAGHQLYGDSGQEPVGPGSGTTKARVSSGTSGCVTGIPEYQLNLTIALLLQQKLEAAGIGVYMIRSSNDVSISNVERAQAANASGADVYIRIHADGSSDPGTRGAHCICMSSGNPWNSHLYDASYRLSSCVINHYCAATGFSSRGVVARDDLTGTNWSEIPVTLIEMGFMSNPDEDSLMNDPGMQDRMAQGICDGILEYYGY